MSMQLPLLLASLGSIAASVPFGKILPLLILLAMAPSMLMLVILVVYQRRDSRIDNEPGSATKPRAEAAPEHLMRDAIEQLNGIATALHNVTPKSRQAPEQTAPGSAAKVVSAGQLDRFDESASQTGPLPLTSETPPSVDHDKAIAQLAAKVGKLSELASRMRDEGEALQRNAVDPQRASEGAAQNRHYLTFALGDEQFAVSIQHIHGVVEAVRLVAEPSIPPKIRKAIKLQGALVPVIDLGARFGYLPIDLGRDSRIIILEVPGDDRLQLIGALVDRVGDVLELPPVEIEPPTVSDSKVRDDFTRGTLMLDNRPITLLDISWGFSTGEFVLHSAARSTKQENQPV